MGLTKMEDPMIPGVWTQYFRSASPEQMVELFASRQWFHLELSSEHGEELLGRGDPEKTGKEFAAYALERGVHFPQGHLWLTVDICAENQAEVIDDLKRWLDLYLATGVKAGVLHPGGNQMRRQQQSPAAVLDTQTQALGQLCTHLQGTDFTLCLENVPGTPEVEQLLSIIKAVDSPRLGICLDTGHLNMAGGDQGHFLRQAGDRLKAMHLADNEGKTDQHMMPFGRGNVDWSAVIGGLKALRYEGLLNLEIPGESKAPLPVLLAKLDYLQVLMRYLVEDA